MNFASLWQVSFRLHFYLFKVELKPKNDLKQAQIDANYQTELNYVSKSKFLVFGFK